MGDAPHVIAQAIAASVPELFDRSLGLIRSGVTRKDAPLAEIADLGLRMWGGAVLSPGQLQVAVVREVTGLYYAQCRILDLEAQIERLKRGREN